MRRGLTILELLVVMGITAMLSALVISYGFVGREQTALSIETVKIAQVIARAKSLSVSTLIPESGGGEVCGYGVRFDAAAGRYVLVGFRPDPNCSMLGEPADTFEVERFSLSILLEVGNSVGVIPNDQISSIYFLPPDPVVYSSQWAPGSFAGHQGGKIYLKTKSGGSAKEISVNGSGQISF